MEFGKISVDFGKIFDGEGYGSFGGFSFAGKK